MRPRDFLVLVLLGAIWGGAFPLMRVASPVFGAVPLAGVRVALAAVVLLALVRERRVLIEKAGPLLVLGIINTAVPFSLFAYATLSITGGLAALLNSTTPMFGAVVAWFWVGERLTPLRIAGIVIAFGGVGLLVHDAVGAPGSGAALGVTAALVGSALYGFAASYARRYLGGVDPSAVAAGSVTGAALVLAPFAIAAWPRHAPGNGSWLAAVALGLACTALAYALYFRLLRSVGANRAVTVTFLIPAFGILWGALFLGEPITTALLTGCAIVLAGTALATGIVRLPS